MHDKVIATCLSHGIHKMQHLCIRVHVVNPDAMFYGYRNINRLMHGGNTLCHQVWLCH
ncbi:Uncharacterised protein [Mycobacteroides abscessus subsp. abscessus]|nr:Uncharacterised protein [Mycobacteroides abscessus subsp. abscessus]